MTLDILLIKIYIIIFQFLINMRSIFAACLASFALASVEDHWAVMVAGGKGYTESYMYQSDVA